MNRIHNLDYLRGIASVAVMLVHYLSWTMGKFSADTIWGRIAMYSVPIFYILSGLTLHHVYFDKLQPNSKAVFLFFRKRILRIFPLLWLATFATIVLSKKIPTTRDFILNLTGLFGFIKWDGAIAVGVWSIGNELVYYTLFPFLVFFTKSYKAIMVLLSVIIFSLYLYFAFYVIDTDLTVSEQWRNCINPLNLMVFFLGGFLMGVFSNKLQLNQTVANVLLLLGLTIYAFFPVSGETTNLITGFNRIIFSISCFFICLALYKLPSSNGFILHKPLLILGEISYSIYLLHPVVFEFNGKVLALWSRYYFRFHESVRVVSSIIVTLILSYYVYRYFELYFMKLGKTKKLKADT